MNKAQLVDLVAKKTRLTKTNTESVLDAAIEIIQQSVATGQDVKLVGFGTFSKTERKPRPGRNPKTGKSLEIPGSVVPKFRPGKEFRERLK